MNTPRDLAADSGAIVVGWLTKVAITLLVLGFLSYDGVSMLTTNFSLADRAQSIASEAADNVKSLKSVDAAYQVSLKEAKAHGDTLRPQDFSVAPNGQVTVILHHTANSLWMVKISALKKYLDVKQAGTGNPSS